MNDTQKSQKVKHALMKLKKFVIEYLKNAAQ